MVSTARLLGLGASAALHVALIAAAVLYARSAPASVATDDLLQVYIDPPPPLGVLQGDIGETGAPRVPDVPKPAAHHQVAANAVDGPASKDGTAPQKPKDDDKKAKDDADKEKEKEDLREAVRKAMLAPPDVPAGSGTAAAMGSPTGVPGGTGAVKKGISGKYAGMLDGWFSARLVIRGLGLPWDDLKKLSVRVSVSASPDGVVQSFSMGSSGNGEYDARVRSVMQSSVGQKLPAPPDDDVIPPTFTLVFRCRSQDRCS